MTGLGRPRCCCGTVLPWLLAAAVSAVTVGMAAAQGAQGQPSGPSAAMTQPAPAQFAPAAPVPPAGGAPAAAAPATQATTVFPPQPPSPQRGLFGNIENWWPDPVGLFSDRMKEARSKWDDFKQTSNTVANNAATATQEAMKSAAEATKNAAVAIVRLPAMRVVEARERCAMAANGAPDCGAAAANACRAKGFGGGRPLEVRSSAKPCPAAAARAEGMPAEGQCPDETVVLRAVCQ